MSHAREATTEVAHFSIDGAWLTEHVRCLWAQEDRADHALKTLMTGLSGITYEQALSILEGRNRLVGNSNDPEGVRLVPDEAPPKLPTLVAQLARLKQEKDDAQDEAHDLVEMASGDTVGLASPGGLRVVPRRKTERGGVMGRTKLRRGYDWPDQPEETREKGSKSLRIYREVETAAPRAGQPRAERIILKSIADDECPEPRPPPVCEKDITTNTGWLAPTGKFYPCSYTQHRDLAEQLVEAEVSYDGFYRDAQQELENKGWVKICMNNGEPCFFGFLGDCKARPTDAQKSRVRDYCLLNKCKLPHWARENDEDD